MWNERKAYEYTWKMSLREGFKKDDIYGGGSLIMNIVLSQQNLWKKKFEFFF